MVSGDQVAAFVVISSKASPGSVATPRRGYRQARVVVAIDAATLIEQLGRGDIAARFAEFGGPRRTIRVLLTAFRLRGSRPERDAEIEGRQGGTVQRGGFEQVDGTMQCPCPRHCPAPTPPRAVWRHRESEAGPPLIELDRAPARSFLRPLPVCRRPRLTIARASPRSAPS